MRGMIGSRWFKLGLGGAGVVVPGALVEPDGDMSAMLGDRVRRAEALWKAGKVEKILVSGDHGQWVYDEPDTMRKALVAAGVPPRDVFEDHAGFDTWATMARAHEIFGVRDAVVVTQGFDTPAMAGPKIPIASADGRESWGPAPPNGTPAAGSPDSSAPGT